MYIYSTSIHELCWLSPNCMAETSSAKHPQAHAVIIVDTQARRPELGGFKRRAFFRWHCLHCGKSDHHGSQKMACFLRFWKYDDQFGDYNIHIYIHTCMHCIALHCITYIHSDVSFTMWNPRYFLETPYAFIRHPTKSYCLILLLETLQIPSQVYPNDTPIISKYFSISKYFTRLPIWHPHLEVSFSSARDPHVLRGISRISSWRMTATVGSRSWEATKMEDAIENDNIGNQQKTRFHLVSVVF